MLARLRRFWRRIRKRPPGLRLRYARGALDRRLTTPIAAVCVRRLSGAPLLEVLSYLRELTPGARVVEQLERAEAEFRRLSRTGATGMVLPADGRFLYALVRAVRPRIAIETGTANGRSTTLLLAALERNGDGRLVSIDLPFAETTDGVVTPLVAGEALGDWDYTPLPPGKVPGWMVPPELRRRWDLRLGRAEQLLPEALDELDALDLFFHDSLHEREHMLFEFRSAWTKLRPGGVLVADDVFQRGHDALPAFAREVGRPFGTFGNLGFLRKGP